MYKTNKILESTEQEQGVIISADPWICEHIQKPPAVKICLYLYVLPPLFLLPNCFLIYWRPYHVSIHSSFIKSADLSSLKCHGATAGMISIFYFVLFSKLLDVVDLMQGIVQERSFILCLILYPFVERVPRILAYLFSEVSTCV